MDNMIQVDNLIKKYDATFAVNDISFKVNTGEIVGFLGPNGAGKTTTMKILTCFIAPTSGEIKVAGSDIFTSSYEIRKRIGYLPENAPVYHEMLVKDYLAFIADIRKIPKDKKKGRISNIINKCGLSSVVYKYIHELSKGYRQRVGLAQALIHNPDILILDEPTSGLDPSQIIEIRKLIKDIGKEKTIILCTHILQEVEAICNRVLIINHGKIVADDTSENLKSVEGHKKTVVSVRFKKPDEQKIKGALSKIPEILNIEDKGLFGDELLLRLHTDKGTGLPEKIFNMAVNNNFILTELYKDQMSLEDIFIKLTTKN